jgi:tRNA-2-methylthio-N6-dimethylallyladenosine synthase
MQKPEKPAAPPAAGRAAGRVHIITFGCQMNEADSEAIAGAFRRRGYELTDELKGADAVVVNTCTVRQHAEDKAISQIGRLRVWKERHPEGKVFVVGCAAQKLGEKYLKNKFGFVDEVVGAKAIERFEDSLIRQLGPSPEAETAHQNIYRSPQTAYTTIMRGCSLKCSYCIVPAVRGPAVFLSENAILEDAKEKLRLGAKEIVLLGQTVNAWKAGGKSFTGLLSSALKLPGLLRLRFMSPHPLYYDKDFFKLLAGEEKLARHMHLPAQSGSDRILKEMRRGYTRAQYLDLVGELRQAAPGLAVSTDFIVGYPGETEKDFEDTLALVREGEFSLAYCFKYSPRTDKPEMATDISEKEMDGRLGRLLEAVKETGRLALEKRIGKIEDVLFETDSYGRTSGNFALRVKAGGRPGEMLKASVTAAAKNTLHGILL